MGCVDKDTDKVFLNQERMLQTKQNNDALRLLLKKKKKKKKRQKVRTYFFLRKAF